MRRASCLRVQRMGPAGAPPVSRSRGRQEECRRVGKGCFSGKAKMPKQHKIHGPRTCLRLEQIAYRTGYSEPAAPVRAFKRWTRTTPVQFR